MTTDDAAKRGISLIGCDNVVIAGQSLLDGQGGITGLGIGADSGSTNIIVERPVRATGFGGLVIDLGTATTNRNKTLFEPFTLSILDDQVASFVLSITAYGLIQINARSGDANAPHGAFWARGGGSPFAAGIGSSLANCNFATGALAPASGVDGKFTISANNDSRVWFSNRIGGTIIVDVQMLT